MATAPPDIRDGTLYRIEHNVLSSQEVLQDALVHRTYEEFVKLDELLRDDFWLPNPPTEIPSAEQATVDTLNAYMQPLYGNDISKSTILSDFLGINWNGSDISFMYDLSGFLEMLLLARVPHFMPEPPLIEKNEFVVDGESVLLYIDPTG